MLFQIDILTLFPLNSANGKFDRRVQWPLSLASRNSNQDELELGGAVLVAVYRAPCAGRYGPSAVPGWHAAGL